MQGLANNFAEQVAAKVEKDGKSDIYGQTFRYVDAFLGKVQSTDEIVTIEQYASGTFRKYINNNGSLSHNQDIEKQRKAESLTHFSFVKSNRKLLLVDIQGGGYNLTDPEIATLLVHLMRNPTFFVWAICSWKHLQISLKLINAVHTVVFLVFVLKQYRMMINLFKLFDPTSLFTMLIFSLF